MNKKDYICAVPFTSLEMRKTRRFLCCDGWLKKHLPENSSPFDAWNSDEANDIRNSMLDGSYRYCDSNICPFLHQLDTTGIVDDNSPIYHKNNIPKSILKIIDLHKLGKLNAPRTIQFSFDDSCNLKCPSCRIDLIMANGKSIKLVKETIVDIQNTFGEYVEKLYITGTGDPFISVGFRDFLRNIDKTNWPNLKTIHLHTNATRWDKKMWDSMKSIHPYVSTCEISIDAATKDTYENKVRLNGDFDVLINNLKFISTIPTLKIIKTSFIVQKHNYKEMKQFYDLMYSIFGNKVSVYYGKILNWDTFSDSEFKEHQVWNPNHVEHFDFLKELNKTLPAKNAFTNLQEFIKPHRGLI